MTMQILVGYGANSACAPAAIFESKEAALAVLVPLLGEPTRLRGRNPRWECVYGVRPKGQCDDERRNYIHKVEENWARKMRKIFKRYYDGCGGCDLELEPVKFGQLKKFEWDLD